jgi:hypothetical protein
MRHNIEAMPGVGYPGGFSLFIGDTDGNIDSSDDAVETFRALQPSAG